MKKKALAIVIAIGPKPKGGKAPLPMFGMKPKGKAGGSKMSTARKK